MGRVTFLDPQVVALVNREFCASWKNLSPGYRVEHLEGDRFEQIRGIPNGQASENVLTLVATEEGELLHAIPGHWKPKEYQREIEFGLSVAKACREVSDAQQRRAVVQQNHRERLSALSRGWDGGALGRQVIENAHFKMIDRPLRKISEIRDFAEYALGAQSGAPPETLLQKMQLVQQRLQTRLQSVQQLIQKGDFENAEARLGELLRQLSEESTPPGERR